EPIFGLDMTELPHRDHWYQPEFFAKQSHPFLKMGVTCNSQLQASIDNQTISNLYCAGALLAHYDPVFEGCGSGVAISTGFHVAEQMIKPQCQTTEHEQQERTIA
ncbi:FAD-binding protein, partial [Photobacterium sp. OFAV2-7]|uniref:FAD-binding protein n=1 Tax=Photobacterium sp. OFAV2-7 TaxID=2917748 RepID=UPI001EF560C2